jgi:hypothetical protein
VAESNPGEPGEVQMLEERGGGYVVNVKDANWRGSQQFGKLLAYSDVERPVD